MGGAKVSSKITIIENLLSKVDNLILGGGMTYTFVKANGGKVGDSICEDDYIGTAKNIEKLAKEKGVNLVIATDVLAADDFSNDANTQTCAANAIPDGWQGLDAGPESIAFVPAENVSISKTPTGPFQRIVPEFSITSFILSVFIIFIH